MTEIVEMKIVTAHKPNVWLRCSFCDERYQTTRMMCAGWDEKGRIALYACPNCLKRDALPTHLRTFADCAQKRAAYLRSLVERLKVPSYAALEVREAEGEEQVLKLADKYLVPVQTAAAIYMEGTKRRRTIDDEIPF